MHSMRISYHIHWACDHVKSLHKEPPKCTTHLASEAKANPTANVPCPSGLTNEVLGSDEVCSRLRDQIPRPEKRALRGFMARKEGASVDEMDEDVSGMQEAMYAWGAKQSILRVRMEVFMFMAEKGMLEEGFKQMRLKLLG